MVRAVLLRFRARRGGVARERARAPGAARGRAAFGEGRGGQSSRRRRSPDATATPVMILPQVHLRKPCYDFYFL